jgi:hypothetical protein
MHLRAVVRRTADITWFRLVGSRWCGNDRLTSNLTLHMLPLHTTIVSHDLKIGLHYRGAAKGLECRPQYRPESLRLQDACCAAAQCKELQDTQIVKTMQCNVKKMHSNDRVSLLAFLLDCCCFHSSPRLTRDIIVAWTWQGYKQRCCAAAAASYSNHIPPGNCSKESKTPSCCFHFWENTQPCCATQAAGPNGNNQGEKYLPISLAYATAQGHARDGMGHAVPTITTTTSHLNDAYNSRSELSACRRLQQQQQQQQQ